MPTKKKNKKKIVVAVSGGFDPVHIGHIRMFKEARKFGDELVVILNNDNWLRQKKINIFMPQKERKEVIESIKCVDKVVLTHHGPNTDDMSVCRELREVRPDIFANGGDRKKDNIPEVMVCAEIGCKLIFNLGRGGKIQSSSWLLSKYVANLKSPRKFDVNEKLNELKKSFAGSTVSLPLKLKMRVAEVMLNLMNHERGFGLFVVLGWKDKWNDYMDFPDKRQDIYGKHRINIADDKWKKSHYYISETVNFDGAILLDNKGDIIHSGTIIEGLHPRLVARKINPGKFDDLSEQFGFNEKVHARHLAAITASYVFKNTSVFTVSEESDSFHVFEGGRIIYNGRG